MGSQYSEEFKKSAVQKFHNRGSRNVAAVCSELGVSGSCLYKWVESHGKDSGMKKPRSPQDWSATEKLKAVIEFEGLPPEKQGEFLRTQGLHTDHIATWKKSMQAGLEPASRSPSERAAMSELKAENKELKRDLHRKDRALAETTALLVLKKKADLIWGTGDDE
jgi:transposase